MARRSRLSVLKRQRELKKSEKAARKRARRHGVPIVREFEPRATITIAQLEGGPLEEGAEPEEGAGPEEAGEAAEVGEAAETGEVAEPSSPGPPIEPA